MKQQPAKDFDYEFEKLFDLEQQEKRRQLLAALGKVGADDVHIYGQFMLYDLPSVDFENIQLKGVTKNGRCSWQVLSLYKGQKTYICSLDNVLKAAVLYDIHCIQIKGLKCKVNFNYTKREIQALLRLPNLLFIKSQLIMLKKLNTIKLDIF